MAEIKNCGHCGSIFASSAGRDICPSCYRKEEEDFKKVYRFLTQKKNREATIEEIVEATEVEEDLIIKFMKQNRLRASQFPNLAYACEKCGKSITEGRLCQKCSSEIQAAFQWHEEQENKRNEKEDLETIYYTINKENK